MPFQNREETVDESFIFCWQRNITIIKHNASVFICITGSWTPRTKMYSMPKNADMDLISNYMTLLLDYLGCFCNKIMPKVGHLRRAFYSEEKGEKKKINKQRRGTVGNFIPNAKAIISFFFSCLPPKRVWNSFSIMPIMGFNPHHHPTTILCVGDNSAPIFPRGLRPLMEPPTYSVYADSANKAYIFTTSKNLTLPKPTQGTFT